MSDAEPDRGDAATAEPRARSPKLGAALRRAWIGYQRRLDAELAKAGFEERRFPDRRVLRLCSGPEGTTIARIGRELGITRQGASKIVGSLRDGGYVSVTASETNGREKTVQVTQRARDYLAAHRRAARTIEQQLQAEIGPEVFMAVHRLLDVLGGDENVRLVDYLRRMSDE